MAGGYSEQDIIKFKQASDAGKLSTKHRKLVNDLILSSQEQSLDLTEMLSDYNMLQLDGAIASAKDPEIIKILKQEKSNITTLRESPQMTEWIPSRDVSMADQVMNFLSKIWSK